MSDVLESIEGMLGRFNGPNRDAVIRAITDDSDGCLALAWRIRKRNGVSNPAGVFMSCLAAGEHRHRPTAPATPAPTEQRTPAERARGLYRVKLAELDRRASHWTHADRHEFALDYALDHCGQPGLRPSEVVAGVQMAVDDADDIPW